MSIFINSTYGIKKDIILPPFYTDLKDERVAEEYKKFRIAIEAKAIGPIDDHVRTIFDYQMTMKFADEWNEFLKQQRKLRKDQKWKPQRYEQFDKWRKPNASSAA